MRRGKIFVSRSSAKSGATAEVTGLESQLSLNHWRFAGDVLVLCPFGTDRNRGIPEIHNAATVRASVQPALVDILHSVDSDEVRCHIHCLERKTMFLNSAKHSKKEL